ncbi:precorrin-3B synthase [Thermoactinospora rubra]|uniref:precorrin-3B synthase n=1 Tax=Thermoactinospora rubra TaxID=1088767 RepID=UPI001F0AAEE6|nr:precorrin-3B synthase [Thermoactinospora rubra]
MAIADFPGRARPDACPGALQVHEAADGPLARVRLPGGVVAPSQLGELASCAAELGSGVIELTSRANVQVRGLRDPAAFAGRVAAAGLLPSPSHERVRNIVASPLSGRGLAAWAEPESSGGREVAGRVDTEPLVEALDEGLCARPRLARLPGRFLFAVDDGTGDVAGLGADVTFTPSGLLLAGAALRLDGDPVALMLAAAEAFLDVALGAWRIAELPGGPAPIAALLGGTLSGRPPSPPRPQRAGLLEQRDGRVALEAVPPLGRLTALQAQAVADAVTRPTMRATARTPADAAGPAPRFTPWRTVIVPDLTREQAAELAAALEAAGLATDPGSPWVGVTACTGRPGCGKALADVRADAAAWVASRPSRAPTHWAGCERRCGLPRGEVVQMVATGRGYDERQP